MKNPTKIIALTALTACMAFTVPQGKADKKFHVVIDAAHGGKDYGAAYGSVYEKDVVFKIAEELQKQHKDEDVVLHFTRKADHHVTLEERVQFINAIKPDLVISLHVNFSTKHDAAGAEVFYQNQDSRPYAEALGGRINQQNLVLRNVDEAQFFLLKKSQAPAVHLEMGFLSNPSDRNLLTTEAGRQKLAGIVDEFVNELN